jgi:hypothetical protein
VVQVGSVQRANGTNVGWSQVPFDKTTLYASELVVAAKLFARRRSLGDPRPPALYPVVGDLVDDQVNVDGHVSSVQKARSRLANRLKYATLSFLVAKGLWTVPPLL